MKLEVGAKGRKPNVEVWETGLRGQGPYRDAGRTFMLTERNKMLVKYYLALAGAAFMGIVGNS